MSHNQLSTLSFQSLLTYIRKPILAPLLDTTSTRYAIVGAVALHMTLVSLELPSWECPLLHGIGVPCPGCGLSRATSALFHGEWQTSLQYHALAPFFVIGLGFIAVVTVLPQIHRQKTFQHLEWVEKKTGFVAIYLLTLVAYWLARLIIFGESYISLMLG